MKEAARLRHTTRYGRTDDRRTSFYILDRPWTPLGQSNNMTTFTSARSMGHDIAVVRKGIRCRHVIYTWPTRGAGS